MVQSHFTSPSASENYKLQVWAAVQHIPPGKVTTYGRIAMLVGAPEGVSPETYRAFGARWVGGALASCPPGVPWQRVINAQGKVSLPGKAGEEQRAFLEAEGVQFDARGRVDLKRYGWNASGSEQLGLF